MNRDQKIKLLVAICIPVFLVIFYVTASLHFSYTPDDTYIYLQYARNVVNGNGISFNAGEPTYGFTSPLWLMFIALGGKMGIDFYIVAKVLDLFFASISLAVFFMLAFEMIRDLLTALFATIVFSFNAWLIRWAGSGMETSLGVLLVLLAFWYCIRNEYLLATIFTTLLTLVRPESFLLMGLIVVDLLINSIHKKRAIKMGVSLVLLYLVFLAPWWIYAYSIFGTFVPNSALAKAGLNFQLNDIIATFTDVIQTIGFTEGFCLVLILVCGSILFLRRKKTGDKIDGEQFFLFRQSLILLLWIGGIILLYALSAVNVVSRYLLLTIPFVVILAFLCLQFSLRYSRLKPYIISFTLCASLLMIAQNQIVYHGVILPGIREFESGMQTCLQPIGDWFRDNTPPETIIVTADIGAIGYRSERKIFDTAGLASKEVLPLLHAGMAPYMIIENKLYRKFCRPDYLVHRANTPDALAHDSDLVPVYSKPFSRLNLTLTSTTFYTVYKIRYSENFQ